MSDAGVFVVGGGPAGLAAAIAAAGRGLEVVVADRLRPPIDKVCGEGLMPGAVAALEELGVAIPAAQSFPLRGIRFLGGGHSVEARFPAAAGLGVRRTVLHAALVRRAEAAGVDLRWGAAVEAGDLRAGWIIGADGQHSHVRAWAGLDSRTQAARRFGYRRHYGVAPWTDHVEIYWGEDCQIYVTPVAPDEVCVALLSKDLRLKLDAALPRFADLRQRLSGAPTTSAVRGAVCASRALKSPCGGRVALVGDASGSVDAIAGEGLCLAFQQALALAPALAGNDLTGYRAAHRQFARRPRLMAGCLLAMDRSPRIRVRALRALAASPETFRALLATHAGELRPLAFAATMAALGFRMLSPR